METLERVLAEHAFFEGLEPRYLQLLVGCASNVRFDAGQYIFREGEEARRSAKERFWAGRGWSLLTNGSSTPAPWS